MLFPIYNEYVEYLISIKFRLHRFWYRQDTSTIKFTIPAQLIVNLVHAGSSPARSRAYFGPQLARICSRFPNFLPSLPRIPFGMKIWLPKKKARDFEPLAWCFMERVTGIEPALSAWKAEVLPLNHTRDLQR